MTAREARSAHGTDADRLRHADIDSERPALVQGRHHLPGARPRLLRQQQRRHRRLRGPDPEARLPPGPRASTRLWLLPFYPSPLRDDGYDIADYENIHPSYGTLGGLRPLHDGGAPPRHPRHHRARHQPHVRPAPVVPGGAARARRLARARLLRLERHQPEVRRRPHHLHRHRDLELELGRHRQGLLLAPLLPPPAGPQLRQSRGAATRSTG